MKRSSERFIYILIIAILLFAIVFLILNIDGIYAIKYLNNLPVEDSTIEFTFEDKDIWTDQTTIIRHACGEIEGNYYTNSKEAMDQSLSLGFRYIEVDFMFTSDNKLVCAHDWLAFDINSNEAPSYESFMNAPICNKYTPLDANDIINYMVDNPDLYIITDCKEDTTVDIIKELANLCNYDESLMNRIIIQVYTTGQKPQIQEIYPFPDENFILSAYMHRLSLNSILYICKNDNVRIVVIPENRYSSIASQILSHNISLYVHTINRPELYDAYIENGLCGVYSDMLPEKKVN